MIDKFIIVGLPRSRTSWLANLFTYGPCFCMHDGLGKGFDCFPQTEPKMPAHIKHLGNSDSGYTLINCVTRNLKVIAVFRNEVEAQASFVKFFSEHPYPGIGVPNARGAELVFNSARLGLRRLLAQVPTSKLFTISFDQLDEVEHVEDMWDFICPEEPFFRERYFELNNLRVNPASEKVRV